MSKDKRGLGDIEFAGKVKTQTLKQLQLEWFFKSGAVIPASKLAEIKALEFQRVRDFEAAITDEENHKRPVSYVPWAKIQTSHLLGKSSKEISIIFQHKALKASLANTLIFCQKNSYFFLHMQLGNTNTIDY